jgi:hypothetical protein
MARPATQKERSSPTITGTVSDFVARSRRMRFSAHTGQTGVPQNREPGMGCHRFTDQQVAPAVKFATRLSLAAHTANQRPKNCQSPPSLRGDCCRSGQSLVRLALLTISRIPPSAQMQREVRLIRYMAKIGPNVGFTAGRSRVSNRRAETAIKIAIEQFKIPDPDQQRGSLLQRGLTNTPAFHGKKTRPATTAITTRFARLMVPVASKGGVAPQSLLPSRRAAATALS